MKQSELERIDMTRKPMRTAWYLRPLTYILSAPDVKKLYVNLSEMFFELQLRDETRLRRSVWDNAGEDTLRGLFLRRLRGRYEEARSAEERMRVEQAARWGLAALDNAEEVVQHENQ